MQVLTQHQIVCSMHLGTNSPYFRSPAARVQFAPAVPLPARQHFKSRVRRDSVCSGMRVGVDRTDVTKDKSMNSAAARNLRRQRAKQPEWANGLKRLYDSVVDEPLPDSFAQLLDKLDKPGNA